MVLKKYEQFVDFENFSKNYQKILSYKNGSIVYLTKDGKVRKEYEKPNNDFEFIKSLYPTNPSIFPIIYEITDNTITMEFLNQEKAEKDYKKVNSYLKKKYKEKLKTKYPFYRYLFGKYESDFMLNFVPEFDDFEIKKIADRFQTLIDKIMKIINNKHYLLDIHSENFGYDKKGNLKMFDI